MGRSEPIRPREDVGPDMLLRAPVARTQQSSPGPTVRVDLQRQHRVGVPELVLGEGKADDDLREAVTQLLAAGQQAIVTRLPPERWTLLDGLGERQHGNVRGRVLVVIPAGAHPPMNDGHVGLLAAGSADVAVAEEARAILEAVGVNVHAAYDVGIAGPHRLQQALDCFSADPIDLFIVVAGREGTLPTLVAGLVHGPIIGVPVSSGYGAGGSGTGALTTMLQSCTPVAVVNIDGGAVAALLACQILGRIETGRQRRSGR